MEGLTGFGRECLEGLKTAYDEARLDVTADDDGVAVESGFQESLGSYLCTHAGGAGIADHDRRIRVAEMACDGLGRSEQIQVVAFRC